MCDPLKEEPDEDVDAILRKLYRDDVRAHSLQQSVSILSLYLQMNIIVMLLNVLQFIDDLALVNSAKLKPIQLPLSDSPTLSTTCMRASAFKHSRVHIPYRRKTDVSFSLFTIQLTVERAA